MQNDARFFPPVTVILLLCVGIVWGAPDDPVVEKEVSPQDQQRQHFWGNQVNFDQYVFSSAGAAQAQSDWRAYARQWLELELDGLTRDCGASPDQLKEIELAFEGELARFDVRYREARTKWDELKKKDLNEFNQHMWQIIGPLQSSVQFRWMGDESLARRTIRGILSAEQLAKYEEAEKARQAFANEVAVSLAIMQLDEFVPMKEEQRLAVEKLLAPKLKVERRNQGYIWLGGVPQILASIPARKLEPIFTADQWKRLDVELKRHRPQVQIQGGFKLFGR